MKEDTAIKQLLDTLYTCQKLGLRQIELSDIIKHIKLFQNIELSQMADCFAEGRLAEERGYAGLSEVLANDYIEENYTYYLWQTL